MALWQVNTQESKFSHICMTLIMLKPITKKHPTWRTLERPYPLVSNSSSSNQYIWVCDNNNSNNNYYNNYITNCNPGLAQNFCPRTRPLLSVEFKLHAQGSQTSKIMTSFLFNSGMVSPFEHLRLDCRCSALVELCIR